MQDFFKNSKTIWMSENFQNIVLDKYTPKNEADSSGRISFSDLRDIVLTDNVNEIIFQDPDAFLEELTELIKKQINGEDGQLLTDSSANYFFIKGKDGNYYSILVRWEQSQKLWRCGAYFQDNIKLPNIRIFFKK